MIGFLLWNPLVLIEKNYISSGFQTQEKTREHRFFSFLLQLRHLFGGNWVCVCWGEAGMGDMQA